MAYGSYCFRRTEMPLILRKLHPEDESSFLDAVRECEADSLDYNFAVGFKHEKGFSTFRKQQEQWSQGKDLPMGFVPCSYYVGVLEDRIVGRIFLRHELNDFLARIGGHLGYCVVPSFRRQGIASQMLKISLPICAEMGLEKILVTCNVDNVASRKVIEKCGGIYESITDEPEIEIQKRKYWIPTIG